MLADDRALRRRRAVHMSETAPAKKSESTDDVRESLTDLKTYVMEHLEYFDTLAKYTFFDMKSGRYDDHTEMKELVARIESVERQIDSVLSSQQNEAIALRREIAAVPRPMAPDPSMWEERA